MDGQHFGDQARGMRRQRQVNGGQVGPSGNGNASLDFLRRTPDPVSTPEELAGRMARPTHMISDIVAEGLRRGRISADLSDLHVLVPDLG